MKIVKFKNGKYGVRRGVAFEGDFEYLDLESLKHWWDLDHEFMNCAEGTLDAAEKGLAWLNRERDFGEPV